MQQETQSSSGQAGRSAAAGGPVIAVIIGIIVLLLIIAVLVFSPPRAGAPTVSPQDCSSRVIAYINANLASPGQTATLINISEENGTFTVWCRYQGRDLPIYASGDCTLLFPTVYRMGTAAGTPLPAPTPVRSARPTVDLYVMSFCPYGTQAEAVMRPVVDLLGKDADIRVRYITDVSGTTPSSVQSLHGPPEANEDLVQVCIRNAYPDAYWEYLKIFNNQCFPVWQNASALATCRENVTAALGIDLRQVGTCASGAGGLAVLKADEADSNAAGAGASPTLIINGVKYSGARTPEAYKQAICASFDSPPAACTTTLSSSSTAASGGCG